MDTTPEKGPISNPISTFEDSPVFSYICNLSPLEIVKPLHVSQTFSSYSPSSVPSIFTSPQISSHKETKFLRRHNVSDPSNQDLSSGNGKKICSDGEFGNAAHKFEEQKLSTGPEGCIKKINNKRELVKVARNQNTGIDSKCVPSEMGGSSSLLVPTSQNRVQNGEVGNSDWEIISDIADFLIFESPNKAYPFEGSFAKSTGSKMRLCASENTQADILVGNEMNETENNLHRTGEDQLNATEASGDAAFTCLNSQETHVHNPTTEVSNESACNLQRRRCLFFDMGGAQRKFCDDGSSSGSTTSLERQFTSNVDHQIHPKPDNDSSRCSVPGIGLHLNALAETSMGYTASNQEIFATRRQSINDLSSEAGPNSFANNQQHINQVLPLISVNRDIGPGEDAYQLSRYFGCDNLNQSSSKKRKLENGENKGCKRCNCKKSKCLKLYCECFAAGLYCVEPCSCQECFNKPIHEDIVLATRKQIESRNPLAFAPKVIRTTKSLPETMDDWSSTPASARHKRGCNCRKSGCLKKYCECYQGGVGCSINCRCEGCKNMFGRKDGSHIILAETEVEETESHENISFSKHCIQINTDQTPGSSFLQSLPEFEKLVSTNLDNVIPEILRSPTTGIKFSSPNSKRVSPPHRNSSRRELILRSIPLFPSLKE